MDFSIFKELFTTRRYMMKKCLKRMNSDNIEYLNSTFSHKVLEDFNKEDSLIQDMISRTYFFISNQNYISIEDRTYFGIAVVDRTNNNILYWVEFSEKGLHDNMSEYDIAIHVIASLINQIKMSLREHP